MHGRHFDEKFVRHGKHFLKIDSVGDYYFAIIGNDQSPLGMHLPGIQARILGILMLSVSCTDHTEMVIYLSIFD